MAKGKAVVKPSSSLSLLCVLCTGICCVSLEGECVEGVGADGTEAKGRGREGVGRGRGRVYVHEREH